jgi:hypothetical protein
MLDGKRLRRRAGRGQSAVLSDNRSECVNAPSQRIGIEARVAEHECRTRRSRLCSIEQW